LLHTPLVTAAVKVWLKLFGPETSRLQFRLFKAKPETAESSKPETVNVRLESVNAGLGFSRCDATTTTTSDGIYPRFYYGDSNIPGDNGYWLIPDTQYLGTNANIPVYYLEAPYKVNLMGQSYFYLEIEGMNTIDETIPFAVNRFTTTTNGTAGVVKSAFAKIPVTTTPISQWYDNYNAAVKIYNPPAERIRKLKIKIRYHNGVLVDFGTTDYSILLEFTLMRPQNKRDYSSFTPESYS
jgi:hypothetical protein